MKLKVDEQGHAVLQDGKPIYVHDDGKEIGLDAPALMQTLQRTLEESKKYKERAQTSESKLEAFNGIDDPAAVKKALDTVKNLDHKKLVDAGEVEKVKAEAIKAVEEKYKPLMEERDRLKGDLDSELIGGLFSRSKFIFDKIAIPADLMQARFAKNFEVQDRKAVAKYDSGNLIYSRTKPGELATPEEALEILVDAYPQKDHILKGLGKPGSGAPPNIAGTNGGKKQLTRQQFDAIPVLDRAAKMKEGYAIVD